MMKTGIRKLIIAVAAVVTVLAACTLTTKAATLKNITNVYITKSGSTYHVNYDCSAIDSKRIYAKTLYNILKDGNYKMCKTCAKEIGMNIYRGCTHGCIYGDSRSLCYQFTHPFEDIEVKQNAPELLEKALSSKRKKCIIATGSMSDPYMHCEKDLIIHL